MYRRHKSTYVGSRNYDAFISYSHSDRDVASKIQRGLHTIGRRAGRLHALRAFRDATDMSANPDLWSTVVDSMNRSHYMIVVLSRAAATSQWVNQEVEYWLANFGPHRLMIVLKDGRLSWSQQWLAFDPSRSDAIVPALTRPGVLPTEPFYVDVGSDAPWDIKAPLFREKLIDLAAPIHGKPKSEIASLDLKEQRRYRRIRRLAVSSLAVLTVVASIAAGYAFVQRERALEQRNEAISLALVSEGQAILAGARSGGDTRAIQEILASQLLSSNPDQGALLDAALQRRDTIKIIETGGPVNGAAMSPDGRRIAVAGRNGDIRLLSP